MWRVLNYWWVLLVWAGAALGERLNCTCGRPSASESRIVNGLETGRNEFPWMVAIREKVSPLSSIPHLPYCAGSLVSDRFVLTAAHCLAKLQDSRQWQESEAVLGVHWARSSPPEVEVRNIKRAVMKVQYVDVTKDYDIAMLELDEPIQVNEFIYPVCLPYDIEFPTTEPWVIAVGWGRTSYRGRQSEKLMKSRWMQLAWWDACEVSTKYRDRDLLTDRMLCAISDITDACLGDSGGPLLYYHPQHHRWYLVGVTSFGKGCNERNDPGVYTNLFNQDILTWVTCANTGEMCQA